MTRHASENEEPVRLLERIRSGDEDAERALVERYERGLSLMLRRLVSETTVVDDVLQETFALALKKARCGEIRQPDRLAGFLRSVARNQLIVDRRKASRYAGFEDSGALEAVLQQRTEATGGSQQLDDVLRAEEASLVRQLLDELRFDRDRELLIRFYLSEDDRDRLCADLGILPGHFRRVLYRARQRLRELWEQRQKREWIELRKAV